MKFFNTASLLSVLAISEVLTVSVGSSSTSSKSKIVNGSYVAVDTEDGSNQVLTILCRHGLCDIALSDVAFSTCSILTGNFGGGVGFAKKVPEDSLDNFKIGLFCLQPGELEIDVDNSTPTTTLTGDMVSLPNGAIRRSGPGFVYFKTSNFGNSYYSGSASSDESGVSNGRYLGVDTEDGTSQELYILCSEDSCNIQLSDYSFSTCARLTGAFFFGGVGIANNVPKSSLNEFDINLFCLQPGQLELDIDNDAPTTTITGDMKILQDGVINRTGPGFTYFRTSTLDGKPYYGINTVHSKSSKKSGKRSKNSHSEGKEYTGYYLGADTEDGTFQNLDIICHDKICDITLADFAFSTCTALTGNPYYNGLAIAKDVPQDSLDNFDFDIFCLQPGQLELDIDNDTPTSNIKGDMVLLQNGIIQRTGPGFIYYNSYTGKDEHSIVPGLYMGTDTRDGTLQSLGITCIDELCDIYLYDVSFSTCALITGNRKGGVGVARNIPENSLDDFKIDLFCLELSQSEIDIDNDTPKTTVIGNLASIQDGVISRTGLDFIYFKVNTD